MLYIYEPKTFIPDDLLSLFNFYQDAIDNSLDLLVVQESSEDYILDSIKKENFTDKCFSELLFKFIDSSNYSDTQIYKKAFIDKRLFSKIRSDSSYHPSFGTVTLLALALNLSTDQYLKLLNSASYSLPQNSYVNITLKYCFDNKIYDVLRVNELVFTVSGKEIKSL